MSSSVDLHISNLFLISMVEKYHQGQYLNLLNLLFKTQAQVNNKCKSVGQVKHCDCNFRNIKLDYELYRL